MSRLKEWLKKIEKPEINTFYFIFFLLFVMGTTVSHFFIWKTPFTAVPFFFFLHALGQCFLEAGTLFLLGFLLKRWMPKWLYYSFIGFCFAILLAHFTNFTILRLMDASISYIFHHFFGSGIHHLIPAFLSLNLNATMILIVFGGILSIPFIGIAFYFATSRLSIRFPFSMPKLVFFLLIIGAALFALDLLFHPFLQPNEYSKFQKALPLGTTFISPHRTYVPLPAPVRQPREESSTRTLLSEKKFLAASKPNIYLFVIETLRKDYITEDTAPNLTRFSKENISLEDSYSNSNSTHPSWFSIFHSTIPFQWTSMRDTWEQGSIPLQILKNFGYTISIFSSADLRYFNMDVLLFGKERGLIDRVEEYTQIHFIEPWQRDSMGLEHLFQELENEKGRFGNLFILFFDSTHSEYSFPPQTVPKFTPISKEIDYLTLTKENIEPLKNRYRNSIFYVDELLGRFFQKLKEKNLYDSAIIAITGDHGEEFFEEGAIFHGTHLNRYQTHVPLVYKFQSNPWIPTDTSTTHLDLFPSIIHYLTGRSDFEELFDGQSLFAPRRFPYRICFLNNAANAPSIFTLENTEEKHLLQFGNPQDIYTSKDLEILSPSEAPFLDLSILAPLLK